MELYVNMAGRNEEAVSTSKKTNTSEVNEEYDEELDFCSPKFNPERALLSRELVLPRSELQSHSKSEFLQEPPSRVNELPRTSRPRSVQQAVSSHQETVEKTGKEKLAQIVGTSATRVRHDVGTFPSHSAAIPGESVRSKSRSRSSSKGDRNHKEERTRAEKPMDSDGKDTVLHHGKSRERYRHERYRSHQSTSSQRDTDRQEQRFNKPNSKPEDSRRRESRESYRSRSHSEHKSRDARAKSSHSHSSSDSREQKPASATESTLPSHKVDFQMAHDPSHVHPVPEKHGKQKHAETPSEVTASKQKVVTRDLKSKRQHEEKMPTPPPAKIPEIALSRHGRGNHQEHEKPADPEESESTKKARKKRNVLTRMAAMEGPLQLLTRCVEEHLQVRVMTRSAVTVRGICRGYIVAFDKFMNMAMIDVDEIYRRPVVLGKVRSRRSHKLLAAQRTLQKEREELQAKWKAEQDENNSEVTKASSNLQDLSIVSDVSMKDLHSILSNASKKTASHQICETKMESEPIKSQEVHKTGDTTSSAAAQATPTSSKSRDKHSVAETDVHLQKLSKSSQMKLRRIQSVYEDLKAPLSPFEREALMLGIPDENVDHRHVNQLFIRGENIVMVSIIEDF